MRPANFRARFAAAAGTVLLAALTAPFAAPAAATARPTSTVDDGCLSIDSHGPAKDLWAQTRMRLTDVATVATGAGVRVAVIDSGVNYRTGAVPQMKGIRVADPANVITPGSNVTDCVGHGTAVVGILAAQPDATENGYVGVAPDATIIPIKYINAEQSSNQPGSGGTVAQMVAAIGKALDANAQVINISATFKYPNPQLAAAIRRAQLARAVIVAASGNDSENQQNNCSPCYPAAYSRSFDNVIAVGSTDKFDQIAKTSVAGQYVNLAAPGQEVEVVNKFGNEGDGFFTTDGTSFAAPFVSGTVALLLQKFPRLSPSEIRTRLEATADPPPGSVPDERFGYGIVNPYLALTTVGTFSTSADSAQRPRALPAPTPPRPPDRHLQHLALGIGLSLLGCAIIAAVAAGVVRSDRRRTALR